MSLDNNSVDFDARPSDEGDEDDEQEVTLDLYGEDPDHPGGLRADGFYLDEALAEHERSKQQHKPRRSRSNAKPRGQSHGEREGTRQGNGVDPMQQNGRLPQSVQLQNEDVDLEGLESTDI